jgi:hypothetical protein
MPPVIFLPIIIFFGFFALLVGGFLFLVFKIIFKTRSSYWKGEIIDKKYNEREEDDKKVGYCVLVVKTDEGVTRNIAVTSAMYQSCNIGDTLEKPKGKLNPVKSI